MNGGSVTTDKVDDLQTYLLDAHDQFQRDVAAHKDAVAQKLTLVGDGTLAGGAAFVGGAVVGAVGGVVGGVASTGADVVGTVGTVADATHNAIDVFFSNLRQRLGI